MLAVLNKEIAVFFNSLIAYVIIGVFLLTTGLFLWVFPDTSILEYGYAGLDSLFNITPYIFMFLIPAVTMRSIAEERKEGTYELIATQPLTDWQIVLGKYFACVVMVLAALIPTLVWYYSVYQLGAPQGNIDSGAATGSYIGLFLLGSAYVAIGIFSSSLTNNQIISFVIAVFLCFVAYQGLDSLSRILFFQSVDTYITAIGISQHYESISRGVLDTRDAVYFVSFISLFLVLTKTVLGGRKW